MKPSTLFQQLWDNARQGLLPEERHDDAVIARRTLNLLCAHVEKETTELRETNESLHLRVRALEKHLREQQALTNKPDNENSLRRPIR